MTRTGFSERFPQRSRDFLSAHGPGLLAAAAFFLFYCLVGWLASGGQTWWHLDFVYGNNIFWGDDAYRYFLVRSAWLNPDLYFFNFLLPGQALLDGTLTSLAGDSLLAARVLKALVAATALFLLYRACIHLGTGRVPATAAMVLLGLMPLYGFISLSFYGESWFMVLLCLALWLYSRGRLVAACLVVSVLPLVRAEGILFVGFLSLYGLWLRDWRRFFIPGGAGFVYLLLILSVGPGLEGFLGWRGVTGEIYRAAETWFGGSVDRFVNMFSPPWILLGALGFLCSPRRDLWPFLAGALGLLLGSLYLITANRAAFEPRYIAAAMPVLALGFALACRLALDRWRPRFPRLLPGCLTVVALLVLVSHLSAVYGVRVVIYESLARAIHTDAPVKPLTRVREKTLQTTGEELAGYRELADVVTRMTHANPRIETLFVSEVRLFYFLDPQALPSRVTVAYPLSNWPGLVKVLGEGVTVGYFPRPPYAGVFPLSMPRDDSPQLLYVEELTVKPGYPFHWSVAGHDVYLFSGQYSAVATDRALEYVNR